MFQPKTRGIPTNNNNNNNHRRQNDLQPRQHQAQASSSRYSGYLQYDDRKINGFDFLVSNAAKKTVRSTVPELVPISRSIQPFMNGNTNNWNHQNNTRNGTSSSISPQPTRGRKSVFSFGKKPTAVSKRIIRTTDSIINMFLLFFSNMKTVLCTHQTHLC